MHRSLCLLLAFLQLWHGSHQATGAANLSSASRFYYQTDDSGKRVAIHDGNQTTGDPGSGVSPINGSSGGTRYTYDLAGRLATETIPAVAGEPYKVIAYSYDKVGNRLSRMETQNPGQGNQVVLTTNYSYTRTTGELPSSTSDIPDFGRYASAGDYAASYALNDWLWKESRYNGSTLVSETKYDYNANGAMVRERAYNANGFVKQSNLSFSFDGKLLAQSFSEPGSLMYVTSQVLYNYDADGNRIGLQRQQLGTVGMSYGVVTSENHQYLVDTSQPYAEVIQEKTWLSDGAGNAIGDAPVVDRYDIGLDRLRVFRYQVNANAPPTAIYSNWLLFDGLGSTRIVLGDSGSVVDEFGYADAFGIPYRVTSTGRDVAGPGFFLNGQQWDGGSSWGRSYWSGTPGWNVGDGLYFNRARYYQPGLGRFIGEDPIFGDRYIPSTLNRYLYSANDSVNFSDPSGESFVSFSLSVMSLMNTVIRVGVPAATVIAAGSGLAKWIGDYYFPWFSYQYITPVWEVSSNIAIWGQIPYGFSRTIPLERFRFSSPNIYEQTKYLSEKFKAIKELTKLANSTKYDIGLVNFPDDEERRVTSCLFEALAILRALNRSGIRDAKLFKLETSTSEPFYSDKYPGDTWYRHFFVQVGNKIMDSTTDGKDALKTNWWRQFTTQYGAILVPKELDIDDYEGFKVK